ncbi:RagB/SusD family nutrient uptake outer membrane protein [soil metagenome]
MKYSKFLYRSAGFLLAVVMLGSCKKSFLTKPPTDAIVDANFYQNDEQVLAGTALLYSRVWFDYNDKASYNIGDFRAGTAYSAYNDRGNVLFNTTGNTPENSDAWRSFFIVVGQSNLAIENINKYAGAAVTPAVKKMAIAEARFLRALAYRHLVMNWGPVPIIENNLTLLSDTSISRNTVPSVWKFITKEMREVANDLPEVPMRPGRITKWSAEGMLARFYLTRAGVESNGSGTRNQQLLDSAKYYAQDVILHSGSSLLASYENLFKFPYDNNSESLFSLQWVYSGPTDWGTQNSAPAYLAYSSDIANGDGWGGDKSATWWMMKQYEGFETSGDSVIKGRTLDQRLHATFMLPGAKYPEISQTLHNPDGEQKLVFPFNTGDNNFLSIKKYITGKAKDVGGAAAQQRYGNDTYMMRLAEMYLVYAEAVLGNSASTTDPTALEYFNKVHTRAGLPARTLTDPNTGAATPLTFDAIFKERVVEFAMEAMAWYDLVSLHYYNPAKAYAILNSQDRGLFYTAPDKFPDPTQWTIRKTAWATQDRTINANSGNFLLPIPAAELSQAPNLLKPPVDY